MPKPSKKNLNKPAIEVKNLTVAYNHEMVLNNLSFQIPGGTITAIIGPNGAGKTTLLRAMLNLIPIKAGTITINAIQHDKACAHIRGHHLDCPHPTYVPQRFSFDKTFPITVYEFLNLALRPKQPKTKIDNALKEIGMIKHKDKLMGHLSGGQVQRVLIARAILGDPEIIFLDEPAVGIDIGGEMTFYEIIQHLNKKHGTTCVLVSHEIDVVFKYADQVICLNKKMVCQGIPQKVLSAETLKKLYGEEIGLYEHKGK
ncbi:ATP-binding cassette domain-containing protein [Candidatus Saccharibacteria bacterium]|nr:metal ABC transporter ATP-binding protein [Candidatus Saccharibacteria bacterium]NIS37878.1 metal ABC transporter ATP-binding protein [Candidatus Saccharibacteria bacterium]NIV03341.1 ATP-binding cassette domain-containing protein [Calditrichia bacterium]NIV71546.1 ATP-binding cassette domain-containing protein [Calditrichia bacterium]NIV98129.1 ATP-binding cassette domain-containing protein [Candidatus Saccharibacteria bacterium]